MIIMLLLDVYVNKEYCEVNMLSSSNKESEDHNH